MIPLPRTCGAHEDVTVREKTLALSQDYLELVILTISLFDLLLCFSDEITYIWSSPRKLSTILIYTVVRYFPMAKVIFVLLVTGRCPGVQVAHCTAVFHFVEALGVFSRAGIMTTLFARSYALYGSLKHPPLVLLALLSGAAVILGFYEVSETSCAMEKGQLELVVIASPKCMYQTSPFFLQRCIGGSLVSIVRLVAEALGIGIVLYQSRSYFGVRVSILSNGGLLSFIVRSGLVSFMVTFILELSSILFNSRAVKPYLRGALNPLPLPIPATLIARFILNLQKIAAERTHVPTSDMTLSFAPNRLNNNTELWIDLEPL